MPSSYSPRFGFEQPETGELQGLWGGVANDAITELLDETIDAVSEIALSDANTTLTIPNAVSSPNRASTFRFTGTLTAIRTVTLPAGDRFVRIINATTGGFAINVQNPSSSSPVSVTNGLRADLAFIGTAIRQVNPQFVAPVSISGSSASTILTVTQSGAGDALAVSGPSSFSDDVKLGNGTSLDPILTFTGDSDTGMYLAGADEIGFSTGGVERFAIGTTDIISGLEIILPGNATDPLGAVPLQQLSGAANVTVSDTAPVGPSAGDLWFNSDLLILSIYYNDGDSFQWVQTTPTAYGLSEAAGDARYVNVSGDSMTGALYIGGDLEITGTATKPGGGTWSAPSDERLKDIIGEFDHGLEEIASLRPMRFTYKSLANKHPFVGLIAQDVQETALSDEMVGLSANGMLSLDLNPMLFAMVNAIKQLKARVEELEKTHGR